MIMYNQICGSESQLRSCSEQRACCLVHTTPRLGRLGADLSQQSQVPFVLKSNIPVGKDEVRHPLRLSRQHSCNTHLLVPFHNHAFDMDAKRLYAFCGLRRGCSLCGCSGHRCKCVWRCGSCVCAINKEQEVLAKT